MRSLVVLVILLAVSACNVFVAGDIDERRKRLYERNNNQEYCDKNPKMCVNNIPWS